MTRGPTPKILAFDPRVRERVDDFRRAILAKAAQLFPIRSGEELALGNAVRSLFVEGIVYRGRFL